VGWDDAVRNHWKQTVGGVLAGALILWLTPSLFVWTLPVLIGLWLAIPVSVLLSSVRVGSWLRKHRLLMIPEETDTPRVLRMFNAALSRTQAVADGLTTNDATPWDRVVRDPSFHRFHLATLASNPEPFESSINVAAAVESALRGGLTALDRPEQVALLSNPHALRRLHVAAWAGVARTR
jgi:membrane glycosyltransferase